MKKREEDRISSLFWLLVAAGICFGSIKLKLGGLHKPGPGFFPFLAGAILGILSLIVFSRSFKQPSEDTQRALLLISSNGLKMASVIIALILYTLGMSYLGFFFSTLLFLGFLLRYISPQRWTIVVVVSVLGAVISYGVFQYWLDVQLPKGILGF